MMNYSDLRAAIEKNIQEYNIEDEPAEPGCLSHALADILEACDTISREITGKIGGGGKEVFENALAELVQHLAHINYHIDDTPYLRVRLSADQG